MLQAGHLSIQTPFLLRKMLVGNSQTLCDLHRTAAGCAFLPNAFLMEFMIQWYIRWAQTHLKEKVPTMILSAPTITYLLLFDVRYVIDILNAYIDNIPYIKEK